MSLHTQCDVLVVGAGPAGMRAAIACAKAELKVIVAERAPWEGGQIFRHHGVVRHGMETVARPGDALKQQFRSSPIDVRRGFSVIAASRERVITLAGAGGIERIAAKAVIVATGASERIIPVPGWTAPGVIGLAALTNMMKADDAVPEGRIVLAGVGPLLYSAAYQAHSLGAHIVAVIDPLTRKDWARAIPRMVTRPLMLAKGGLWMAELRRAGIPILRGAHVQEIRSEGSEKQVSIAVDGRGVRVIEADAVCIGHGLRPNTEMTRLLGANHHFDAARGGLVPTLIDGMETSVPGYFVAGDCGGISGADAALTGGSLIGEHVARLLGGKVISTPMKSVFDRMSFHLAAGFGRAMAKLAAPRFDLYEAITDDTVICRCEEVTRSEFVREVAHPNTAKMRTRCGMGPCQGRFCGDTATFLVAQQRNVDIGSVERWTPRLPIVPTRIQDLVGQFRYEDLVTSGDTAKERGLL